MSDRQYCPRCAVVAAVASGHAEPVPDATPMLCPACVEAVKQADREYCERTRDAVTCHKCGAVVEDDALARQTMADGTLMWPEPFCRACLLAGLRRLKAWLAAGGAGAMGEDGE